MRKACFWLAAPLRKSLVRSEDAVRVFLLCMCCVAPAARRYHMSNTSARRTYKSRAASVWRCGHLRGLWGFAHGEQPEDLDGRFEPQMHLVALGNSTPEFCLSWLGFAPCHIRHITSHRMASKESLTQKWLRQNIQPYLHADRVFSDVDVTLARFSSLRPKTDVYSSVSAFFPVAFHLT